MVDIAYTGLACVEILYGKLGVGGTHTVLSLNRVLYCLYVLYSTPHRPTALSIIASSPLYHMFDYVYIYLGYIVYMQFICVYICCTYALYIGYVL